MQFGWRSMLPTYDSFIVRLSRNGFFVTHYLGNVGFILLITGNNLFTNHVIGWFQKQNIVSLLHPNPSVTILFSTQTSCSTYNANIILQIYHNYSGQLERSANLKQHVQGKVSKQFSITFKCMLRKEKNREYLETCASNFICPLQTKTFCVINVDGYGLLRQKY